MEAGLAAMTIQERRLGTALATSSFFEPNICWKIPPRGASTTGGTSSRTARVRGEVKRERLGGNTEEQDVKSTTFRLTKIGGEMFNQ